MRTHELKTHPGAFGSVKEGAKRAEFRLNDRDFNVGDILRLREFWPVEEQYTGDEIEVKVTHIVAGPSFGIPINYVMMSIAEVS